jgi:hypothetical protein
MEQIYRLTRPIKDVLHEVDWKNALGLCMGFLWLPAWFSFNKWVFIIHEVGGEWSLLYFLIACIVGFFAFMVHIILYWTDGRWVDKTRYFHGGFWTHVAKGETGILVGGFLSTVVWLIF